MFLWTHLTINKTKTQCFFQKNFKKTNCNSGKVSFFQVFLVKKVSFLQDETKVIANFARFLLYSCNIFLFPLTIKNESDSFFKVKSGAFPAIFLKNKTQNNRSGCDRKPDFLQGADAIWKFRRILRIFA